jgi:hypothetical protein
MFLTNNEVLIQTFDGKRRRNGATYNFVLLKSLCVVMGGFWQGRRETIGVKPVTEIPGTWSGARAGTSSPASGVLYGQVEMVESQDGDTRHIPSLVSVHSGSRNSSTQKFKLYKVPWMEKGYEETCFHLIHFAQRKIAPLVTKATHLLHF